MQPHSRNAHEVRSISTVLPKFAGATFAAARAMTSIPNPTPDLPAACAAFGAFLENCPKDTRLVCLHDVDADGITAGALWQRTLERLNFTNLARLTPDRERNAWTDENRRRVAALAPDRLFVLDLGSAPAPLHNAPTCLIDHHRPEGVPPNATLISAYSWNPIPTTSLLMHELGASVTDLSDVDWIAAIGVVGDLGGRAPFALLDAAKKKYTAKYLKEAAALLNAARRSSSFDPEVAARALLAHDSPRELVNSEGEDMARLKDAREEVKRELAEARKVAPIFSAPVALLRLNSPCQVHPLIAQQWRARLPKYIVIAANAGYLPDRVNFSARTDSGQSVLDFLRGIEISPGEGDYGHGHDAASGGSLPVKRWRELLHKLGFAADVWA
jgi:single-stranded-DNA-specific exonuclease